MNILKEGDRLYTGAIVSAQFAETYNALSKQILFFEARGVEAPEHLLNGRHNLFNSYATA